MRRLLVPASLVLLGCHTDSAVAPPGGGGGPAVDALNMSVGEVRVLTPSQLPNGIQLSTNAAASDYLIVVANTNPTPDVLANYVVKGDLMAGDAARTVVATSLSVATGIGGGPPDAQQIADAKIRAFERSFLNPSQSIPALRSRSPLGVRASLGISPIVIPGVGQTVNIKVPDEKSGQLCSTFFQTTGTVKALTAHAAIIVDNASPPGGFVQADYDAIAAEFDNTTYPTDAAYFGNPTDIDANGHIILYYTPEVNKLTPANQSSFIGGFFYAGDFFPTTQCQESNVGEVFYLLAPDPNGTINGNKRTTAQVRQGTRGTVAHEFEHMINAGNRFVKNVPAFESVWLDEGLAHTAEDAVGRVVRGFGDFQTLSDADLFPSGNQPAQDAYNAFFGQNLTRFKTWLQRPDTSSGISTHADANLSSRGAIWALLRWTGDQYSGGNFRAYTKKLAAGPDTGVKNLVTSAGQPLDTLLAGWMVANYSDHSGIPGLPAKYNYVGYNMHNAVAAANSPNFTYPLLVTPLPAGATITTKSLSGSGTYYKVNVPAGASRTIMVQDPTGANATFAGAHVYVLRVD